MRHLLDNSRFYILSASVVISLLIVAVLRLTIDADQLYAIRLQQTMGLVSLCYWYLALLVSPLTFVLGKKRMKHVIYARRAIGVSAAYFALFHLSVALWGQLGGLGELERLPGLIQTSLVLGGLATCALLIMAATSFDVVVRAMTYTRWKLLHRITYGAFIVVVIHIWMIGTHVTYTGVQYAAVAALLLLAGLESYRIIKNLDERWHLADGRGGMLLMTLVVTSIWLFAILSIPALFDNYHSRHNGGIHAE